MKNSRKKSGFTLPEMIMALSISIIVFSAMAMLLSNCFSIWMESMAQWKLAQHARITRTRILNGGFGPGTGVLAASNMTVSVYGGGWELLEYNPVASTTLQSVYGRKDGLDNNVWMLQGSDWVWAQSVASQGVSEDPDVKVDRFDATLSGDVLEITYRLNLSAAGKKFTQDQTIRAFMVNF